MNQGIVYLMIMMFCASSYSAMQKLASTHISPSLAIVVSAPVAWLIAILVTLAHKSSGQALVFSTKGLLFAIVMSIFAFGIDYFGILGFSKKIPITVAAAVTEIVYISMIVLYGKFLFSEGITVKRILALGFAALASFLAATG